MLARNSLASYPLCVSKSGLVEKVGTGTGRRGGVCGGWGAVGEGRGVVRAMKLRYDIFVLWISPRRDITHSLEMNAGGGVVGWR